MSIFNNKKACLLLVALVTACQSGPEQQPAPEPAVETAPETAPETVTETAAETAAETEAGAAPEEVTAAEALPEAEDFNQKFYEEAVATLKNGETELALELLKQVTHFSLQQLELAEQAFQEALMRNDDDAVAHNHLGILHRQRGEFEEARKRYQRAIDIDSSYAPAYLNLGILFDIYFQDLKLALQHYQKYLALTSTENSQVNGWITDIERRLKSGASSS
jgi:Flp pilus assembly protein TadD